MRSFLAAGAACAVLSGCGGSAVPSTSGSAGSGGSGSTASSAYATVYRSVKWGSAATVTFSGQCSMTLHSTGVPPYHNDYYLAPVSSQYPNGVAQLPVTGTEVSVVPYMSSNIASSSMTFNICPAKAAAATQTNLGPIGYMISGEALFNPYEGNGSTPALEDNVSYSFESSGKQETASFIDQCNSHAAQTGGGSMWHHHAIPLCLVQQIDGSSGPSHLIGIALDGYPVYGGRDANGNTIAVSQLDACNGITSATPEFPGGAYHYVLPIGVTGKQSSLNCYTGSVSVTMP